VNSFLTQLGELIVFAGRTIILGAKSPFSYREEMVRQFLFALRLCWFPLLISTVAFSFGTPRLGATTNTPIGGLAPFLTVVVVTGVAGTAITADLGARKIREELDALHVLRVDPIKSLVVPRLFALMLIAGLLDIYATLVFGISGGIGGELLPALFSNASVLNLAASAIKCSMFGAIVAVVSSYKGMTASGGAAGVGRAVNQAAVIAFAGAFAFNCAFTQALLAINPVLQTIR